MKDLSFLKQNLIAHRGLHNNLIPENSIEAFKQAILNNYIIEFDVHLLKDNNIVVFHDDNLKRMTNIDKDIKDLTKEEINNLTLKNTKYKIPTLEEVLKLVDGKVPIIIELKYDNKVGKLEKELVKRLDNYNGLFCVKSFHPLIVRWFLKNKKEYIRGLLLDGKDKNLKNKLMRTKFIYYLCKPDFLSCSYKLYNRKCINRNIPVISWTIKNKTNFNKYKNKFDNLIVENIESIK